MIQNNGDNKTAKLFAERKRATPTFYRILFYLDAPSWLDLKHVKVEIKDTKRTQCFNLCGEMSMHIRRDLYLNISLSFNKIKHYESFTWFNDHKVFVTNSKLICR